MNNFFTKKDLVTIAGLVVSVIVPKLIFGDEYIEVIEPQEDEVTEPTESESTETPKNA